MNVPEEITEEIDRQSITAMSGRGWAIASLVCANLALAVGPVVFGALASPLVWWRRWLLSTWLPS